MIAVCIRQGLVDANDGVVPRGVGAGAHKPRGLAALGQPGRLSSLVELDVAI